MMTIESATFTTGKRLSALFNILKLLFVLFLLANCSKENFPRINKFKITSGDSMCQKYLEIIDFGDGQHSSCGVFYSGNKSFDQDSILPFPDPKKYLKYCLNLPDNCGLKFYILPYCIENGKVIRGVIDSIISKTQTLYPPSINSIDTTIKDRLIINYNIPDYTNTPPQEIRLCYNINSVQDVSETQNPISLPIKYGNQSYPLQSFINNSTYKFKIFVKSCNSFGTTSVEKTIRTPTTQPNCTASFGQISWQQKSRTKIMLKGSIASTSTFSDYGFCIGANCSPKLSVKNDIISNLDTIFNSNIPGNYNVQLYYECPNMTIVKSPQITTISLQVPVITISDPIKNPSDNSLMLSGNFNITNYLSTQFGFCYSTTNPNPTILNSDTNILGSTIIPTFNSKIAVQLNNTYYVRSFVTDCDETIYSQPKSIFLPNNQTSCPIDILQSHSYPDDGLRSAVGVILNGKLYVGGGLDKNLISQTEFYSYDESASWISKAPMPISSKNQGGVACAFEYVSNNRIYILERDTTKVWQYEPGTNRWTDVRPFPGLPRKGAIAFTLYGKTFVLGGQNGNTPLSDMWEFKYSNGTVTWDQYQSVIDCGPRYQPGYFIINNILYIFGGNSSSNTVWTLDVAMNKWIDTRVSLPVALSNFSGGIFFTFGEKGYAAKQNSSALYEFDPIQMKWCPSNDINAIDFGISISNNSAAYFGLGRKIDYTKEMFKMK
ncbi:MAG: hypothetical protein IPM34_07560 [Saprospiraceae bacterium]|nr:hypothetical protein [Saprospiraceae bacterium]